MRPMYFIIIALLAALAFCCLQKPAKTVLTDPAPTPIFPYRVNTPDKTLELPPELKEISGLAYDLSTQTLWANEDENGIIYRIHPEDGRLESFPFAKKGDFEDLQLVGDALYALKSNGKITRIQQITSAAPVIEKFDTDLTEAHDCEGLGYDRANNRLLIACKGDPVETTQRSIYTFDVTTHQFNKNILFSIKLVDIQTFLKQNNLTGPAYKDWTDNTALELGPSAIAVHPISGNYYILSSVGKVLLVTSPTGTILQLVLLDKKVHAQPEGMAFMPDGTLFISNEGKSGAPTLHRFRMN